MQFNYKIFDEFIICFRSERSSIPLGDGVLVRKRQEELKHAQVYLVIHFIPSFYLFQYISIGNYLYLNISSVII